MKRRDFLKVGTASVTGSLLASVGLIAWTPLAQTSTINKTYYITDGCIEPPDQCGVYEVTVDTLDWVTGNVIGTARTRITVTWSY